MFASFQTGKDSWEAPNILQAAEPHPKRVRNFLNPPVQTEAVIRRARSSSLQQGVDERTWLLFNLRPPPNRIEAIVTSFWKRWAVLVLYPSVLIWVWCAVPFPYSQSDEDLPNLILDQHPDNERLALVDTNFYFFLIWFFGGYLAIALLFITALFNLYRLNWWPNRLGGKISYFAFWSGTLLVALVLHKSDLLGVRDRWQRKRPGNGHGMYSNQDWESKTFWTSLASMSMALPAWVCFLKLRKDRRQHYRHSMTVLQRTFLERQLTGRIPRSYKRFLWFMGCISVSLCTLTAGQGFASIYLASLPHSSIDGVVYVWTWIATVQILSSCTIWILEVKVRSRALLFVFRYYFYLAHMIFYRTLFARLRTPDQFLYIQILNSIWVCCFQPTAFSRLAHWIVRNFAGSDKSYEQHCTSLAHSFYLRHLAENCTIVCFLGYLTILHFGPNVSVFPFFDLSHPSEHDPYNYRLTSIATLVIWATELSSSFIARRLIQRLHGVNITEAGVNEMKEFPEVVPALCYTSVHVISDILLFLIRLNFK